MQGESLGSISGGEICWFFVGGLWKSQVVRRAGVRQEDAAVAEQSI